MAKMNMDVARAIIKNIPRSNTYMWRKLDIKEYVEGKVRERGLRGSSLFQMTDGRLANLIRLVDFEKHSFIIGGERYAHYLFPEVEDK